MSIDHTLALIKAGHADEALHRGAGRLPAATSSSSRSRCGSSTTGLTIDAETQVRRDPPADPRRRAGRARSATRSSSCAASSTTPSASSPTPASARRRSSPASRSSSSSARASRPCCCCRSCSATSRRRKAAQYSRPILVRRRPGRAWPRVAHRARCCRRVFALLPFGREVLEAITALVAVACCSTCRSGSSRGSSTSAGWSSCAPGCGARCRSARPPRWSLVGFTAVYREGFETALFYQALLSFGAGPRRVGPRSASALGLRRAGRRRVGRSSSSAGELPVKTFMNIAVVLVMVTSVAFLGNAVHALQAADVIALTGSHGWPRLPIFLAAGARATGRPCRRSSPRSSLATVYVLGALYVFVVPPARTRRRSRPVASPAAAGVERARLIGCPRRRRRRRHVHQGRRRRPGRRRASSPRRWCRPPTTAADGVAAGVVHAVAERRRRGRRRRRSSSSPTPPPRRSTRCSRATSATVGVIGLGRRPDLAQGRASARRCRDVELAPGKRLPRSPAFFDVTDGLDRSTAIRGALRRLPRRRRAARSCVAEAFAPDDDRNETRGRRSSPRERRPARRARRPS